MGANSAKELLKQYKKRQYRKFTLNDQERVTLPVISDVPWIGITPNRVDVYEKISIPHDINEENQVHFISKNKKPFTFIWKTQAQKLKEAVRWGIVRTESITGKVISSLGRYRIVEHERIARGMISNTHAIKLALLDLYQDRFEALQEVESLVNSNSSKEEFDQVFECYTERLKQIDRELVNRFADCNILAIDRNAISQLRIDIRKDIQRAESYLNNVTERTINACNRARGTRSVLEFVKQQMIHNLYELQGINQDITYSNQRKFALTRGVLNDCIEDARRDIDDYRADPRNAVTARHHGKYATDDNSPISYDFRTDGLSPERQRQVLLGISFIEGWDSVENSHTQSPTVSNDSGTEELSVISATNWKSHRNFTTFLKKSGHFFLNMVKSVFVSTTPWEEEAWSKESKFHLVTKSLRQHASPNEPLWVKPFHFVKHVLHAMIDTVLGIRNISSELAIDMPLDIFNDWASTKALPDFEIIQGQINEEIEAIKAVEDERLSLMLDNFRYDDESSPVTSTLAQAEYHLTPGEANDLLNSIVRGLDGFASLFTHEIFAKDPVAGLLFTTAYFVGAGVIYLPTFSATVFGVAYVNWFSKVSYAMGSSKLAAVIAGGSTQAQAAATVWDTMMHGPKSMLVSFADHVFEDPLTVAAYFGAAYGIGYVLANGIAGHPIPWLSQVLKEDLGTVPETNYPILGGKLAIILWEMLETHKNHPNHFPKMRYNGQEITKDRLSEEDYKKIFDRFSLALWLSINAQHLPKLKSHRLHAISRHIDSLFNREEAASLKKILYPEKERSIAFQIFAIPLGYIPAICRFLISFPISVVALLKGNPSPLAPIREAGFALTMRTKKDLSRLVVATSAFTYFLAKIAASFVKIVVFPAMMVIGRIAGLLRLHPAHTLHKVIAAFHVFCNKVGEFLYPASVTKGVVFANPIHTMNMTEKSYSTLIRTLNINEDNLGQNEEELVANDHHQNIFGDEMELEYHDHHPKIENNFNQI